MACPSNENLIRFIYQESASNEMQEIQNHIEGCEKCHAEVLSLRALDEILPAMIYAEPGGEILGEKCPDVITLAAYLDGSHSPEERAGVETHLAHCPSCLDDLVAAAGGLPDTPNQYRKTPAHLLNEAIRLRAPSTMSSMPETPSVWGKIWRWLNPELSRPRWVFAGAGGCAIAALAIFIVSQLYQPEVVVSPGAGPTLNKLAARDGGSARGPEDVVAESRIELSGDLKQALIDHDPKRGAESRGDLFEIIEKKAPQMPVHKIKNVEIKKNLLIAIASVSDLAGQVKLQLYKDGLLVISADS
jgi:hypothetical protein